MSWNHRVVKTGRYYGIHEVFYLNNEPDMITESPVAAAEEDVEELRETLTLMLKALDEPVLDYEDF